MTAMTNFWSYMFFATSTFLMTEPIIYFVGLFILFGVAKFIYKLAHI